MLKRTTKFTFFKSFDTAQRTFTTEPQNFTVYALPPPSGSETGTPSREAAAFNCEFSALPRFGRRPVIVWEIEQASTGVAEVLDLSGSNTRSTFQYDHIGYFQLHTPTEMDDGSRVRCLARHPQDPSQQVESQWATITISSELQCTAGDQLQVHAKFIQPVH